MPTSREIQQGGSFFSPDPVLVFIGITVSFFVGLYQLFTAGKDAETKRKKRYRDFRARKATERLEKHAKNHYEEKRLVHVGKCIYVTLGYGASNCALIEGMCFIEKIE